MSSPARSRVVAWQLALLLPQPPLALAYLMAVRTSRVHPAFLPLMLLAAFPLLACVIGIRALYRNRLEGGAPRRRRTENRRGTVWLLLGAAVLELAWATLTLAIAGIAIGLRSG